MSTDVDVLEACSVNDSNLQEEIFLIMRSYI